MCKISVSSHHNALDQRKLIAKSTDDLMTSQSIAGRRDFTDNEMFEAMIASALKKLLTSVHFRKRVSVDVRRIATDSYEEGRLPP